tara:strand:- start:71 stop:262 length:192 start_codon:yes stop_codon:yes gene_type:complete
MRKATTYEMASYQYKAQMSDDGFTYRHPIEKLSAEYNKFWVLRDETGNVAAVEKDTGKLLAIY